MLRRRAATSCPTRPRRWPTTTWPSRRAADRARHWYLYLRSGLGNARIGTYACVGGALGAGAQDDEARGGGAADGLRRLRAGAHECLRGAVPRGEQPVG